MVPNIDGNVQRKLSICPAPRVQKFNLQTGQGSVGIRNFPAVERVGRLIS